MNIQPGKIRQRTAVKRSSGNIGSTLGLFGRVALLLLSLAGVINGYIYLNQKISETDKAIIRCSADIDQTNREIEQARIHLAEMQGLPHIRRMMAKHNIKLSQPKHGQVSEMRILSVEQAANIQLRAITTASTLIVKPVGRN